MGKEEPGFKLSIGNSPPRFARHVHVLTAIASKLLEHKNKKKENEK